MISGIITVLENLIFKLAFVSWSKFMITLNLDKFNRFILYIILNKV